MKVNWKKVKWPIISIGVLVSTVAIGLVGYAYAYRDTLHPNVSVQNISIGSQSLQEAFETLKNANTELSQKSIILTYEEQEYPITLSEIGINLNTDETLVNAYKATHEKTIIHQLTTLWKPTTVSWSYSVDTNILESSIGAKINPSLKKVQDAKLDYIDGEVTIIPDQAGELLATDQVADIVTRSLDQENPRIEIPLTKELPNITTASWENQKSDLDELIQSHDMFFNDTRITIPVEEVITWITIDPNTLIIDISQDIIKEYLESVQKTLTSQPINAKIRFNSQTQQIEVIKPGQEGTQLMLEESSKRIKDDILTGKSETELFVAVTSPAIDESQFDKLGLKTLLGRGESNFRGSSRSRVKNINVAADKISSTLIKPGEEFSFVETLGKVDARNGYVPELVIKGNKTIPEYGGGICQVSTTLFRAALNAALPITERRAHSYVVPYYGKPGLDATIYLPKPDFKFKNDTENYILIQHYIVGTILYYEIYGTSTGKTAKTIEPVVLESSPDGSMKTVAYREIYEGETMIKRDVFYSNYRPPNKVTANPLQ